MTFEEIQALVIAEAKAKKTVFKDFCIGGLLKRKRTSP